MQSLFRSTSLPALEQTAAFAQARHAVLAGNIANIDTPGYRSRDLSVDDFQKALRTSIDRQHEPLSESERFYGGEPEPTTKPAMENLLYHDGSDVTLERQVNEVAKNQHMHNLAVALMRSQFDVLRSAIAERV